MKYLMLLFSGLILSGCELPEKIYEPKNEASNKTIEADFEPEIDEAYYYYWPSEGLPEVIYEAVVQEEDNYTVEYPWISNLEDDHPVKVAVNQTLKNNIEAFIVEAEAHFAIEAERDPEFTPIPWDYSIEWLGGRHDRLIWSLAFQVYEYYGGPYPTISTTTLSYDTRDEKIITFADLFTEGIPTDIIKEQIETQVIADKIKRFNANEDTYLLEEDEYLKDLTLTDELLDSWVLAERYDEAGILLLFSPYEVGHRIEGEFETFLPLSLIKESLNPDYLNAFD